MTAVAAEADPYVLPMPAPDSPVVLPKRISPGNPHPVSRYQDLTWSLAPLIDNPGVHLWRIHWEECPGQLRGPLRLAAWAMINGELRPTYLQARGHQARAASRTASAATTPGNPRPADRPVVSDQLTARPSGITQPPWESEGINGYLPAADGAAGGENTTEPLDPQVAGPLLVWAIRVTEDISGDTSQPGREPPPDRPRRQHPRDPAGRAALEAYLLPLIRSGSPLPTNEHKGTTMLARTYIAATTGASPAQLDRFGTHHALTALAAQLPGPCPLDIPVTGQVNGHPWRQHLDFNEDPELMRHLGTAAAIICLYLTGMRPQELQDLRSGCCPDPGPGPDGNPGRHLIRSRHYKNVTDADGNHVASGAARPVRLPVP